MLADVDCKTEVIYTDARDERGVHFIAHPNTGVVFRVLKVEGWENMVAAVKEWARAFPTVRVIGWDVVLSADKGVQLIGGNSLGMMNVPQVAIQKGMLRDFQAAVE